MKDGNEGENTGTQNASEGGDKGATPPDEGAGDKSLADGAEGAKEGEGAKTEGGEGEGAKDGDKGAEGAKGEDQSLAGKAEEAATIPESADKYDFTLSEDIGLKDDKGEPFQFDKEDPLLKDVAEAAFKYKVPQEALTQLLGIYAKDQKATVDKIATDRKTQIDATIDAELKKLETKTADGKNVTGGERVQRLLSGIDAALGDGASKKIAPGLINADIVMGLEKLIAAANESAGKGEGSGSVTDGLRGAAAIKALRRQ